ncbi:MAG: hypothetical protein U1F37_11300 [Alphaproteobacteria bacterium]
MTSPESTVGMVSAMLVASLVFTFSPSATKKPSSNATLGSRCDGVAATDTVISTCCAAAWPATPMVSSVAARAESSLPFIPHAGETSEFPVIVSSSMLQSLSVFERIGSTSCAPAGPADA